MENKKIIRFLESLIILPIFTLVAPLGGIQATNSVVGSNLQNVSIQTEYKETDAQIAFNQALVQKEKISNQKAEAIDAYFSKYHMPLAGTGEKMVEEAEKYGIDWRLLPAIAVRESTGGKYACTSVPHSFFGWGSCTIGFISDDEAIETLAKNLSGNNKNTAVHYSGKTTKQILEKYNPPSIVPNYASQVMHIMDTIGDKDIVITVPSTSV